MTIRYEKHITRDMLRAEPETLFVFGDNLERKGLGGQAREMRYEPNAVGIPTKREPGNWPGAFFDDTPWDAEDYLRARQKDVDRLEAHLRKGGTVVLPEGGLGTGLADLENRSPSVWKWLQADLAALKALGELAPPASSTEGEAG
ncbi:hypothetical protein HCU64_06365 [Methylobacterium sp. C25]|uniref:DUF7831 domain-containing protein n=1 Tax=Methylobacterium sp. C25 TaxID=2721622 RepID=UPI001F3B797C|nr:hypothetical protein [Methylobacterium sp. C25]MCE4223369.1 hypothetical protein [Methylobacterium sp. C25]